MPLLVFLKTNAPRADTTFGVNYAFTKQEKYLGLIRCEGREKPHLSLPAGLKTESITPRSTKGGKNLITQHIKKGCWKQGLVTLKDLEQATR
jgi:hypothetical protein